MGYPYDKFDDCSFSRFGSIVQSVTWTWMNAIGLLPTLVGVSNVAAALQ